MLRPSLAFTSLVLAASSAPRAHVVVILADDWGFANAGYHRADGGGDEARTPHVDALAASGVRLERMYAHAFCGPSRCALLSGRLPLHVELQNERSPTRDASDPDKGYFGVPRNMSTLGDVARAAGYAAHFVGKWDAGYASPRHTPLGRGFDSSLAYFFQANDYWTMRTYASEASGCDAYLNASSELVVDLWEDDRPARALNGTAHEELVFAARAVAVVDAHDAAAAKPLFLYYCPHVAHDPYEAPAAYRDRFAFVTANDTSAMAAARADYDALVAMLDEAVGNVTAALDARGLLETTLVLLLSDNGGPIQSGQGASNYPLRGGKLDVWDGGIRVNAIAAGGAVAPAARGTVSLALWSLADVYATLCDVSGAPAALCAADARAADAGLPPLDSRSLWPLLNGSLGAGGGPAWGAAAAAGVGHDAIGDAGSYLVTAEGLKLIVVDAADAVWTGPTYPNASTDWGAQAATVAPCGSAGLGGCLFNLSADPEERRDLAADRPDLVASLAARLAALAATRIDKSHGDVDPAGCYQAIENGNFWGPWVWD